VLAPSGSRIEHLRSFLFAPADDERKLRKALNSGAHAVIADLEDAVAPGAKSGARALLKRVFDSVDRGCVRLVRVNAFGTTFWGDDLDLLTRVAVDGIVLPKASATAVRSLDSNLPPVVALVETAVGVQESAEIAKSDSVQALALGSIDLAAELGTHARSDGLELLYVRSKLVIDSAAAGLRPPIDTIFPNFKDGGALEAEAELARSLGLGGKLCIHPAQIEVVNRVFEPRQAEVDAARQLVAAYDQAVESGRGVVVLNDRMVDVAVVKQARRLLESARQRSH
jgi:citrate lyase subunit beta/citryl-CoA lyase